MSRNGAVVITGASSGLGAATSEVFAEAGWNVVLAARRRGRLDEVAGRLDGAAGSTLVVPTDVSDPQAVDALIDATLDRFGRVEVLINNAAIDHPGPITEVTVQQWREIVNVNLNGVFYASKAVFDPMAAAGGGYIINISSVAGRKGWPNAAAYCATKFALTGFTQALAGEGEPVGIRCAVIYPGGMDTAWNAGETGEFLAPAQVGRFLLHMATQDASLVVNEAVVAPLGEAGYP